MTTEETEGYTAPEELLEESSVEFSARRDTILYQIRGLFIGYAGLEYLNRVVQQSTIMSDPSLIPVFNANAERLYSALGRYNSSVELISPKNIERLQKKYGPQFMNRLEETAIDLFASSINDDYQEMGDSKKRKLAEIMDVTTPDLALNYARDLMVGLSEHQDDEAYDRADKFYENTLDLIEAKYHVDPDVVMVIAFFGFYFALSAGYMAAYECIRMLIRDYNEIYGYDFFHVERSDYSKALADLRYENIRGDQTTSIDSKAMLQLIVYGAWNNKKFNEPIVGKWTPAHVFIQAGLIDFLGYMKEYHRAKFQMHWETAHRLFKEIRSAVEGPLMRTFRSQIEHGLTQVENKFKPSFQHLLIKNPKGKTLDLRKACVFQIIEDNESWKSGSLPLNGAFVPSDFSVVPSGKYANVTLIHAAQGGGKTTLLSKLASVAVLDQAQVVFIPLSDDMNWPSTAFLPQMEIEDHKRDNPSYYLNKSLGIEPEGVPTIILDIVKELDELAGVALTKYDRIIKVDAYSSFDLDMDLVLDELKEIGAQDFGYSSKTAKGIIAARYLYRKRDDKYERPHSYDLAVANTLINTFLKWRENNVAIPIKVQTDEAAEAGTSTTQGPEQFALKQAMEKCIRITRRGNLSVDLASQLAGEISSTIRNQTVNTFFKNLKQDETKRSQLDRIVRGLTDDEGTIEAVKQLQRNPLFVASHLMFGHSSLQPGEIFLMQTMPAPFMPQIPSVNVSEIYRAYLKQNPSILEEQFLMRQPELWLDLSKETKQDKRQNKRDSRF